MVSANIKIINFHNCVYQSSFLLTGCISVFLWFPSGVAGKAFTDPVVWLTAFLTAWTAVLPSLTATALNVILRVHDKHKVRNFKTEKNERSVVKLENINVLNS